MLSLRKKGTICTSVWRESNSLVSVCIWMGALFSMLCLHWASMYQLVVQRVLWHWTCPENSLLNRVSSQHEPVCVKRTLLQSEQGQSGNMLVIVVSCHKASMRPVYCCWSHRYVTWSLCGSDAISSHLHVLAMCCRLLLARSKSASWLGLSPSCMQPAYRHHVL